MAQLIQMGLGKLGGENVIHKRKFRWTFEVRRQGGAVGGDVPANFVKLASRPNISIEETEINFLNGKTYIPGKGTWETITVTYYDIAGNDNVPLWSWLAHVYNYTDPVNLQQNARRNCYAGIGVCTLYDGCGAPLERWALGDCWPQAVNFGELDYASSEEVVIEVTIRYANVTYTNLCGQQPEFTCCPCVPGGSGQLLGANSGQVQGANANLGNIQARGI